MILITGGLGFIGSHLAREALRRGYDVVLLDVICDEILIRDIKDKVKIVRVDITIPTQLVEAVKKYDVDAVIHYAAFLSSAAETRPQLAYKVNFDGLWNVFEVARIMDIDAVIFASSVAAYGPNVPQIVREDMYTIPHTLYGISKQLGEMLGLWFHRKYGINFAAFRYGSVIGPGRRDGGASAYSTLLIQKAAQREPYVVNVPEDTRIPLVRAKDLVDAVKKFMPDAEITFKPNEGTTAIVRSWPRDFDVMRAKKELDWNPKYASLSNIQRYTKSSGKKESVGFLWEIRRL